MATYTLNLSPVLVNMSTEGGLDTSILNGNSIQRTAYLEVYNNNDRKIVAVKDGDTFTDTMQTITDLSNSGHEFVS